MNKENNRSAAGLRRSAIAERIRLREEWSALKGINNEGNHPQNTKTSKTVSSRKKNMPNKVARSVAADKTELPQNTTSEALRGVVALVEVGCESRAEALRASLSALGATLVTSWSPLVTHLVWSDGGSRALRSRARALAVAVVSPLWVEGCWAAGAALPARAFPAPPRQSDLPSPRALRAMLKKAEAENIPLEALLSDSKDDSDKIPRLRISSDTSANTSHDKSTDTSIDIESRVNTAPRRALPISISPAQRKSRRKLFTHKIDGADVSDEHTDTETSQLPTKSARPGPQTISNEQRRALVSAERTARQLAGTPQVQTTDKPGFRIVLTGMSRTERSSLQMAARCLSAKIQRNVDKRTTHVVLGSCGQSGAGAGDITGVSNLLLIRSDTQKARTLNALLGAARGCKVVTSQWLHDSKRENKWIHHNGYEVPHLKKISQKARVERTALRKLRSDYAYDIFCGIKVRVTSNVDQKDAAITLLNLCGAVTVISDRQGADSDSDIDVTLGKSDGLVASKWVFDSVAAGRMRTTRRYVINSNSQIVASFTQNEVR